MIARPGFRHSWGKPKVPTFLGSPLSIKHPQDNFSLQNVNQEGWFLCSSIQKLQIGGRQSLFGGCRFTFWRVPISILEAEIVLGVLYRKGGEPKRLVLWVPMNSHLKLWHRITCWPVNSQHSFRHAGFLHNTTTKTTKSDRARLRRLAYAGTNLGVCANRFAPPPPKKNAFLLSNVPTSFCNASNS